MLLALTTHEPPQLMRPQPPRHWGPRRWPWGCFGSAETSGRDGEARAWQWPWNDVENLQVFICWKTASMSNCHELSTYVYEFIFWIEMWWNVSAFCQFSEREGEKSWSHEREESPTSRAWSLNDGWWLNNGETMVKQPLLNNGDLGIVWNNKWWMVLLFELWWNNG